MVHLVQASSMATIWGITSIKGNKAKTQQAQEVQNTKKTGPNNREALHDTNTMNKMMTLED